MLVTPPVTPAALRGSLAILILSAGSLVGPSSTQAREGETPSKSDASGHYSSEPAEDGVTVTRDGEVVARYLKKSGSKPVLWPVIGPDGVQMTRSYPLGETQEGEKEDHIHHRSLWFTHGEVNGVDFWAEGDHHGEIVQRDLQIQQQGDAVEITTKNDWMGPDGQRVLSDIRKLTFHDQGAMRAIDVEITLQATDGPVHFGDTKEGSFGIRVAGTMKVDAEQGGKILTSRGEEDLQAWGKQAEWVDYTGPIGGKTYGIAILNHPTSYGFPTRWHVRTYGLFAANPFGVKHFTGEPPAEEIVLADGESMTLRYRVLLHRGTTADADIAQAWKQYVGDK